MKRTFFIKESIGSEAAFSIEDGNIVFKKIQTALNNKRHLTISFKNIELISPSFLNAAFGQLYNHFDSTFLNKYLKVTDINNYDKEMLMLAIENAKKRLKTPRKTPKKHPKSIRYYAQSKTLYDVSAGMHINTAVIFTFLENGIDFKITTTEDEDITALFLAKYIKKYYNHFDAKDLNRVIRKVIKG